MCPREEAPLNKPLVVYADINVNNVVFGISIGVQVVSLYNGKSRVPFCALRFSYKGIHAHMYGTTHMK